MLVPYELNTHRANVGEALQKFTETLLHHRANDAKTPQEQVTSSMEHWKNTVRNAETDNQYLQTHYEEKHQNPRVQAHAQYEMFRQQQQLKRSAYFQEKKRRDELYSWLEGSFDTSQYAPYMDTIFTKYVHG